MHTSHVLLPILAPEMELLLLPEQASTTLIWSSSNSIPLVSMELAVSSRRDPEVRRVELGESLI